MSLQTTPLYKQLDYEYEKICRDNDYVSEENIRSALILHLIHGISGGSLVDNIILDKPMSYLIGGVQHHNKQYICDYIGTINLLKMKFGDSMILTDSQKKDIEIEYEERRKREKLEKITSKLKGMV